MSIRTLMQLFDEHANGKLSDYELSKRLHVLDGKGVLPVPGDPHALQMVAALFLPSRTNNQEGQGHNAEEDTGDQAAAERGEENLHEKDNKIGAEQRVVAGAAAMFYNVDAVDVAAAQFEIIHDSDDQAEIIHDSDAAQASRIQSQQRAPNLRLDASGHEMTMTPDMISLDLDPTFPPPSDDGQFNPSPFQKRLLDHVAYVRAEVGHSTGLLVMATALGKTVFCMLDIQRQFQELSERKKEPTAGGRRKRGRKEEENDKQGRRGEGGGGGKGKQKEDEQEEDDEDDDKEEPLAARKENARARGKGKEIDAMAAEEEEIVWAKERKVLGTRL